METYFLEISGNLFDLTPFLELESCTFQLLMPAYNTAAAHEPLPVQVSQKNLLKSILISWLQPTCQYLGPGQH
jgi:hypothetical protein